MWASEYEQACASFEIGPRPSPSSLLVGDCLIIAGNADGNQHQRVTDSELEAIVQALVACHEKIRELRLPYNLLTDRGVQTLASAIEHSLPDLGLIDLAYNDITEVAASALFAAVSHRSSMLTLRLAGNPLGARCGLALAGLLAPSSAVALHTLDLYGTDLDMKTMVHICGALSENRVLRTLNIGRPLLCSPEDVKYVVHHLALALSSNTTLDTLGADHFMITDSDLQTLLMPLCLSKICSLSLKGNQLSQDAGVMLARLLDEKPNFRTLCLSYNRLRCVGASALARQVATHPSLEALYIDHNSVGPDGLVSLVSAVKNSQTLQALTLWGNDFNDNVVAALHQASDRLHAMRQVDVELYVIEGKLSFFHA